MNRLTPYLSPIPLNPFSPITPGSSISSRTGFSLIEVMVCILILSLGVIGAMKLQLSAMQTAQQSHLYSTALELAYEMADKIRSHHQSNLPFATIDFQAKSSIATTTCPDSNSNCSPTPLSHTEISEWLEHINTALPNAHAVICRDNSPWNNDTHQLRWDCDSGSDKASIVIKLGWADPQDANLNPAPHLALAIAP